ncbi:MAG: 1-acyl-sn-glycerol-3-phosphate acyltransferase, partial [Candidatus Taylorbacteria bacterium]
MNQHRLITQFAQITQFITWPFLWFISHVLFRIHISGREYITSAQSPFIIISNHTSFYDSFLFRLILGCWTSKLPLRFMAVRKFKWPILNM